jgi:RES domain-containing protein
LRLVLAPRPTYRLIPSRFPPIGLFDTVATAADLQAVLELVGWTNDRLVPERLARLPQREWVFGRPNASIVMAAFLHAAPDGGRFNGPDLGAWYASAELATAAAEVGHHLRREALATRAAAMRRTFRSYSARLAGRLLDIGGEDRADLYDPQSYAAGQAFGEAERARGSDGIVYDSVRRRGGINAVAYRPRKVLDVVQAEHFEIAVSATERRIDVIRLST